MSLLPGVCNRLTATATAEEEIKYDWDALFERPATTVSDGFTCSECRTGQFVETQEEEVFCRKCGEHIEYLIDSSAEYRYFGPDDRSPDPSRAGNPYDELTPESSLGTRIMPRPGENKNMRKIRQYHTWNVVPYKERSLNNTFEKLHTIASRAGIPTAIQNEVKYLFSQVGPLEIQRGDLKEGLLAGCLYESLKRHGTPWLPAKVATVFKIDVKHVTKGVKIFGRLLDEHLHATGPTHFAMAEKKTEYPSTHFRHCLEPAIFKLETPRSTHAEILDIATSFGNSIEKYGICSETTPSSLAAASLSLACHYLELPKTNEEVARVCSISSATLQKCLKRLEKWRARLIKELNCSE